MACLVALPFGGFSAWLFMAHTSPTQKNYLRSWISVFRLTPVLAGGTRYMPTNILYNINIITIMSISKWPTAHMLYRCDVYESIYGS